MAGGSVTMFCTGTIACTAPKLSPMFTMWLPAGAGRASGVLLLELLLLLCEVGCSACNWCSPSHIGRSCTGNCRKTAMGTGTSQCRSWRWVFVQLHRSHQRVRGTCPSLNCASVGFVQRRSSHSQLGLSRGHVPHRILIECVCWMACATLREVTSLTDLAPCCTLTTVATSGLRLRLRDLALPLLCDDELWRCIAQAPARTCNC